MVRNKSRSRTEQKQVSKESLTECAPRVVKIYCSDAVRRMYRAVNGVWWTAGIGEVSDLIDFEKRFEEHYVHPKREPKLGGYRMVSGILMLLFIGFQRLGHFTYIRKDSMLCGVLRVSVLPAVSTFWR